MHGNQSSTGWQVKSYDSSSKEILLSFLTINRLQPGILTTVSNQTTELIYFFNVLARKLTILFQASAVSEGL